MSQGLREITRYELNAALETVLLPRLSMLLSAREAGHCMRVTDLDRDLMVRLCGALRAQVPEASVVVLADEALRAAAPDFAVSSTKLVELRNPLPNDELRPPLLVFVPNDLRASAEDSFGVATFEELSFAGAYQELITAQLSQVPQELRGALESVVADLRRNGAAWPYADDLSVIRFLLTARHNEYDREAIGAALFQLALVPDFDLLALPERAPARVARNRECVQRITWSTRSERARALDLGLSDPAFCRQLGDLFSAAGVADPREWTYRIVKDRANWPLAFNRWAFEDGGVDPDSIFIGDLTLPDLPIVKEDEPEPRLAEFINNRVLPISKTGLKKFGVAFRVDPHPGKVKGLHRFVAEVVSRDNGPTGLRRRKTVSSRATNTGLISFSGIGKVDWEEGWHFVRVYAETEDGDRIPLLDESGDPLTRVTDESGPARPNESELFYVLTDENLEVEPPQRAVPKEDSLLHALFRAKFAALAQQRDPATITVQGCSWLERHGRGKTTGRDLLEIRLGKEGKAQVSVSSVLAELERAFLADPEGLNRQRLDVDAGGRTHHTNLSFLWPDSEEADRFVAARRRLFDKLLCGEERLIVQGTNLLELRFEVENYAGAYLDWLEAARSRSSASDLLVARSGHDELRNALSVDSVSLVIQDYRSRRRDALLLGPTHPLRIVWHTAWARLAEDWLRRAQRAAPEYIVPTRDAVVRQLAPVGFPPVMPFADELGRTALAVDNLNPFWSLYAAADEADPRGLIGLACAALALPEPAIGGSLIDGPYLASRVQRYMVQHPYVRTLTINAFNAGRGAILADVLAGMQRRSEFADLRYDVRLFVPDADAPETGEALIQLLTPDSGVAAQGVDAFAIPTESHLHPKLRLAIRSIEEFRRNPDDHGAHLSFLFDVFPAEEIRATEARRSDECSQVHGLIQPFAVEYREDEQAITWLRRPLHGPALPITDAEELTDLVSSLARSVSVGLATSARVQGPPNSRPVVALSLSADERALLHQVHEASDWVLTIDRNLGIEFFDHRRHRTRPDYLIDHSPDMNNGLSHRLTITSRSVAELQALLLPTLTNYGLPASGDHALILLDQLRSLSGRLALKLLSSPTQKAEVLGLALSRLFLEHQGAFSNQIVLPLDAHLELYRTLSQNASELGEEVSFRRTDLALFDLDAAARTVTCRLVEVKCYAHLNELFAYEQLKASVGAQIGQSEYVIAYHFDPQRGEVDRPDRALKNRDLSALLEFYLERAERYGIMRPDAAEEARYFLRHLDDQPYQLRFTRSALIFDFNKNGTEASEIDGGIEFHRIGKDLIEQLVSAAVADTESSLLLAPVGDAELAAEITQELDRRRDLAPSVPTFETAAFLSPARDRTVDWDQVARREYRHRFPEAERTVIGVLGGSSTREKSSTDANGPTRAVDQKSISNESENPVKQESVPESIELVGVEIDPSSTQSRPEPPLFDVMLGAGDSSPQFGIIGEGPGGRRIALDLNQTHTISLFGVQGGGKSYTLGSVAEMASLSIPGINLLPEPLATVIFHYSKTMDYKPEFTTMVGPNTVEDQIRQLRETYGAEPQALADVLLLVPRDKLQERRAEYPDVQVLPLQFAASELQSSHWRFLMGAVGNQATYLRQLNRIMKSLRDDLTLDGLRSAIDSSSLPDHLKDMARTRLELAGEYIDDAASLQSVIRPGRLIIVDLRDEFIEKDEALGLFVVLLQLFADAKSDGRVFNKLVVFDEAHKYIESPDLVAGLIEVVREMRHKGVSIMVASQDPPSVPVSLIELSSQIILHKFNSPAWLKHIQKANAALANLTPERMASLKAGEAFIWSSRATDDSFSKGAVKIRCRPRVTQHGGATRVAVSGG